MRRFSWLLPLLALPATAHAQAYQCQAPASLSAPPVRQPADEPRRVRPIAGYVLTLSWSPEFCRTRTNDARHATQCGGEQGSFGFILHGLWPEARDAAYPQWCRAVRPPEPATVARNFCRMPSARLQAHEWAKHGSCMTRRADTYFRIGGILFDAVRTPNMDGLSRRDVTAGQFREAFAAANDGLDPDMVRLKVNERGWLQEVRLCLANNFRPRRCPAHLRAEPAGRALKIWRGA